MLEKLDKLVEKDTELISSINNARDLVGNGVKALRTGHMMEAYETWCDRLKDILKIDDPDLSEATAITARVEGLYFNNKQDNFDLGEIQAAQWKEKISLKLSQDMSGTTATSVGKMAVGYREGGIEIYSSEGELQQTVLVAFLADGRCAVRDMSFDISLYSPEWKKLDVRFDSLIEGGGLAVDCDEIIYVGYWDAKKIHVFTPSGGKAIKEISCGGYMPFQICVMEPSKLLVVKTGHGGIRVFDQQGKEVHSGVQDSHTHSIYATVCKDGTIFIAAINKEQNIVSIKQYTSELKYMKTLINDSVIEKPSWNWYYLREFTLGELALCTGNRLYIFYKIVSPPGE